jgi:uncharacterized membrane protein
MSQLIVFTYDKEDKAMIALQKVADLSKQHLIDVEDAAVIVKNAKGKVKVQQTLEALVKGSNVASGGFWGLLIGLIFGGPMFLALLGMGLSTLFNRKLDVGIDNQFIKDVGNDLAPGDSALFLLSGELTVDKVADALRDYGGKLYHTSLSKEAEENLAKALEHAPLVEAIETNNTDD